jgi:hypothetical protein
MKIQWNFCSIFNNFFTLAQNIYETNSVHPYSSRAFQQYQKHKKKHCGLGDLTWGTLETNNWSSFINRWVIFIFNKDIHVDQI